MNDVALLRRLRQCVSDERELDPILSLACGGGSRQLPQGKVQYVLPDGNGTVYATVKFKYGRIRHLTPGPALISEAAQDALVDDANRAAAHVHGSIAVSRVLLAERKLTGSYEWRDRVRIDACPDAEPVEAGLNRVPQVDPNRFGESPAGPPYPFMLQVSVERSPNPLLQSARVFRSLDSFQYLLTLLVSGHIRTFDRAGERVWVLVDGDRGIENHLLHPGFATREGTSLASNAAPVYQGPDYYNHLWGADQEMLVPPSIDSDLDLFDSLDDAQTQSFNRATYWYALGIRNRKEPALSTVAFSTAIECLLPRCKRTRCDVCGSEVGPGPTHLFKAHLSRYGTLPTTLHKQRAALYAVRSDLVHGTYAASVDTGALSNAGDRYSHDMLLELVSRRSLLNWLRDPMRSTWHDSSTSGSTNAR